MNKFLYLIEKEKLVDNTELIQWFIDERRNWYTFSNASHCGCSTVLDMLEAYFSEQYATEKIFNKLAISKWENYNKYLNNCIVLKIDFSDCSL